MPHKDGLSSKGLTATRRSFLGLSASITGALAAGRCVVTMPVQGRERPATAAMPAAHPLYPLAAGEIEAAVAFIRQQKSLGDAWRFVSVALAEPSRPEVVAYQSADRFSRAAAVLVMDTDTGQAFEAGRIHCPSTLGDTLRRLAAIRCRRLSEPASYWRRIAALDGRRSHDRKHASRRLVRFWTHARAASRRLARHAGGLTRLFPEARWVLRSKPGDGPAAINLKAYRSSKMDEVLRLPNASGSREARQTDGMEVGPEAKATMLPTIAHVVSQSPSPETVAQRASS
jgi:hypothetical protein